MTRTTTGLALFLILAHPALLPAQPRQGVPQAPGSGPRPGMAAPRGRVQPPPAARDNATTETRQSGREYLQAEFTHIPALASAWQRLLQVQQERAELAREREEIARAPGGNTRAQLERFHDNLAREDRLTSRLQELARELTADAAEIEKQVEARRAALQKELDEAPARGTGAPDGGRWQATRNVRMAIRMYDGILERLAGFRENPADGAAVQRMFGRAGWAADDLDPILVAQAQRRLQQLDQEANDLRRRADLLESQIGELRELLEAAGTWGRRQGPPAGPGRGPQHP